MVTISTKNRYAMRTRARCSSSCQVSLASKLKMFGLGDGFLLVVFERKGILEVQVFWKKEGRKEGRKEEGCSNF